MGTRQDTRRDRGRVVAARAKVHDHGQAEVGARLHERIDHLRVEARVALERVHSGSRQLRGMSPHG